MSRMSREFAGMGHEKEPKQPHGPHQRGKAMIHSHSARPKHSMKGTSIHAKHGRKRGRR